MKKLLDVDGYTNDSSEPYNDEIRILMKICLEKLDDLKKCPDNHFKDLITMCKMAKGLNLDKDIEKVVDKLEDKFKKRTKIINTLEKVYDLPYHYQMYHQMKQKN